MEISDKNLQSVSGGKTVQVPTTDLQPIPGYEAAEGLRKGDKTVIYVGQDGNYIMNGNTLMYLKAGYYRAINDQ